MNCRPLVFKFFALSVLIWPGAAWAKCDASDPRISGRIHKIQEEVNGLKEQLNNVRKVGKTVAFGRCALALKRYGATWLGSYAWYEDATASLKEAVSCLRLEEWYVRQSCSCGDKGVGFTRDEETHRRTEEAYERVERARTKYVSRGIKNPAIARYVRNADELRRCFHEESIQQLNAAASRIEDEIAKLPSDTRETRAPHSHPAANPLPPAAPLPTATAPPPPADQVSQETVPTPAQLGNPKPLTEAEREDSDAWLRGMIQPGAAPANPVSPATIAPPQTVRPIEPTLRPPVGANRTQPQPGAAGVGLPSRDPNRSDISGLGTLRRSQPIGPSAVSPSAPSVSATAMSPGAPTSRPVQKVNGVMVDVAPAARDGNLIDVTKQVLDLAKPRY